MKKVDLKTIKLLRDITSAGIGDCKKALEECDGDVEKAVEKLRIIGLTKAGKKSDRAALEGLISMYLTGDYGTLVELNCETDFVARNDKFIELASNLALLSCKERCTSIDDLQDIKYGEIGTVREAIIETSSVLGEKLQLNKICYVEAKNGVVAGYVHGAHNLGKIGSLVVLESLADKVQLEAIGRQVAMHVVAMKPQSLSVNDLDEEKINNELSIITEQVKSLNKPAEIMKKIIDGRMDKYYEEVVLLEQKFIKDDKINVSDFIKLNLDCPAELSEYKLLALGNGS